MNVPVQGTVLRALGAVAMLVVLAAGGAYFVSADEFTSSSFRMLDPVVTSSGYATSGTYQLWGSISQMAIGTSTAASFSVDGGFLYFPFVSTPVVSATAGNAQVALSWTAATGALGWTVSGYNVGQSINSGGPYTYSASLGNVTSSTRTGLTNGTTYYFVIRPEDALGNTIATSSEVSATPSGSASSQSSSSGGGGGILEETTIAGVRISGRAYPLSRVTVLKDGQRSATTIAGPDANFSVSLSGLGGGDYVFSVFAEDDKGRRSIPFTFTVFITRGVTTNIGGIFLAPTISLDKTEVRRGDNLVIFGKSFPSADVIIGLHSQALFTRAVSDSDGVYAYHLDTSLLDFGSHGAQAKAALPTGSASDFGYQVYFSVGEKNVNAAPALAILKGDVNDDNRVNIIDFSVAAYWYQRPRPPASVDLNGDGKVDLVDFSIMAFYWTG